MWIQTCQFRFCQFRFPKPLHLQLTQLYTSGKYRFPWNVRHIGLNGIHYGIHHKAARTRFDSQCQGSAWGSFRQVQCLDTPAGMKSHQAANHHWAKLTMDVHECIPTALRNTHFPPAARFTAKLAESSCS